ncbi:hypothetical protein ACFX2H_036670 [Malus domestica]
MLVQLKSQILADETALHYKSPSGQTRWIIRFKINGQQCALSLLGPQLMASALRRLAAAFCYSPHLQFVRSLSPLRFGNSYRSFVSSASSEDCAPTGHPEFRQWKNGGGIFHKSACIDPTVFIEFGAVVHSKSVVGEHVCIGSGAVVGPSVTVGQSTKLGNDQTFNLTLPC